MSFRMAARLIVFVALAAVCVRAQSQAPVFRSVVDLVTVDAVVVDANGHPVPGLGAEAFTIRVEGQPRRVVSAQFVSRTRAVAAPQETTAGLRASSNEVFADGRLILLAVDRAGIRRLEGRPALQAAERFLDSLGPTDRMAVMGLGEAGDIEFSRDRVLAKRRLAGLTGEAVPALIQPQFNLGLHEAVWIADGNKSRLETAVRRECGISLASANDPARAIGDENTARPACPTQLEQQARMLAQQVRTEASLTIAALSDLIRRLGTIEGPKIVVLLSEGLVADPRLVDLTALGASAQQARVTVYILQLETPAIDVSTVQTSPTLVEDAQMRADGLARLAGASGGALFRLAGRDSSPFDRILRELSGYYLLAFEASEADRDGQVHRLDVAVHREGATVRARPAFRVDAAAEVRRRLEVRLVDLLRSPRIASELPLRATAYSIFDPSTGRVRLIVGAETEPDDGLAPQVTFGFVVLDPRGVIAASQVQETASRRFAAEVQVDPGAYTLKVAAIDRYGRSGSLPRSVLAGVTDAPLPTSELLLARVPPAQDVAPEPIVDRVSDERILAHLELYPAAGRSLREVDVTLTVRAAGTPRPIVTLPAVIASAGDRHGIARALLPVGRIAPGRYIVRAEVTDGGRAVGMVERAMTVAR